MIDGVADQVDHRVAQPLNDRPVQPSFLADDPQLDLLARAVSQVANHAGEPREELIDGHHAQVERRVPDLPADPLEGFKGVQPGNEPGDFAQALEVVGKHSQLAGQADQVVELQGIDPDTGVRPGTRKRRKPAHLGARARWTGRCRGPSGNSPRPVGSR